MMSVPMPRTVMEQARCACGALALGPVVEDNDLLAAALHDLDVFRVGGMNEVRVAVGCRFEGDDKDVREAGGLALRADIRAVLVADDGGDFLGQLAKSVDDFLKLRWRQAVLELVHHDVAEE